VAEILLKGLPVLLDDEDLCALRGRKLRLDRVKSDYWRVVVNDHGRSVILARFLLSAPPGVFVDHANGNPLDNRRVNIRLATPAQNLANSRKRNGHASTFKGVSLCKGKWQARIKVAGRAVYLGTFEEEWLAADAYDEAARAHFGEFAKTNGTRYPAPGGGK
jgi:hypothetical protein